MTPVRSSFALLVVVALAGVGPSVAQNVLGIDFGSEWIKLAVVQRSAGVQIVLNEASKRKSPNAIGFGPEARDFGDTAMVKPHLAFTHTRELLGKQYTPTLQTAYGPTYFPYEIVVDEERGAVKIREGERFLAPETLVAMVLTYAKSLGQAHTGEKVSDCVITVPGFYRQFERQAILDAALIAGLKVLSLMNDHTALALKYGIDHNVASLTEPQNVLFYDMGSTSTRASIVQFSAIPDKEAFQKNKTLGQLKVLATSWDETLGGFAFTERVAANLEKKSKQPLGDNKRARAKLMQTAEKGKIVLSANKESHLSIESFIGDYDFKASITRAEFEKEVQDLLDRVSAPISNAMKQGNLTLADINKVEVVGGAWRIPSVGERILKESGQTQLQKTMNADEAFCFGAALYAASLSTAFRLRKFGVHDITSFPVSIDIDSIGGGAVEEEDNEEGDMTSKEAADASGATKNVKLFKVGHKIPAKRLLTFKREEDLTFTVKYDGDLPPSVPVTIAKYNITGVKKAMDKYPNGTKPKINVSFRLTRAGLVEVDKAEAAIEEMVQVEVCETIKPKKKNVTDVNKTDANGTDAETPAAAEAAEEKKDDAGADSNEGQVDKKDGENATEADEKTDGKEEKKEEEKPQKVCKMKDEKRVHRVALTIESETPLPKPITGAQFKEIKKELDAYDEREKKIRDRAAAFNNLEAYIYNTREKLESKQELIEVTTKEWREEFGEKLTKMGSWLDEDGWEATTEQLQEKLSELTTVGDLAFYRMQQAIERPDAIKKARAVVRLAEESVQNLTKKMSWLNESHTQIVTNKTDQLTEWLDNVTAQQEAQSPAEDPVFSNEDVYRRFPAIEEAIKRLSRVPKPLPPKKEKAKKDSAKDEGENATATGDEGKEGEEAADKKEGDEQQGKEEGDAPEGEKVEEVKAEL